MHGRQPHVYPTLVDKYVHMPQIADPPEQQFAAAEEVVEEHEGESQTVSQAMRRGVVSPFDHNAMVTAIALQTQFEKVRDLVLKDPTHTNIQSSRVERALAVLIQELNLPPVGILNLPPKPKGRAKPPKAAPNRNPNRGHNAPLPALALGRLGVTFGKNGYSCAHRKITLTLTGARKTQGYGCGEDWGHTRGRGRCWAGSQRVRLRGLGVQGRRDRRIAGAGHNCFQGWY